jgi:hypothetical protein
MLFAATWVGVVADTVVSIANIYREIGAPQTTIASVGEFVQGTDASKCPVSGH